MPVASEGKESSSELVFEKVSAQVPYPTPFTI